MRSPYTSKNRSPDRHQCAAITSKGEPCPRLAAFSFGELWYCMTHLSMARRRTEDGGKKS
jgi:hypothetical protein